MDKKEQILHYHRIDGLSQREIASRVGVSRKTVKRYITEYETLAQTDPTILEYNRKMAREAVMNI